MTKIQAPPDKSFSKGLILLQHLALCEGPVGVSELAGNLGLTKSNVHRLLQTLMSHGFVHQDAKSRYSPTLRYWELGYEVWLQSRSGRAALDDADALALKTGCLVHITLADSRQEELVLFERIGLPVSHPMRRLWPTGARVPVWRIIGGWSDFVAFQIAYIAALPPETLASQEAAIRDHLKDTGITLQSVADRVAAARDCGYAENLGSGLDGVEGTASAFRNETGDPVGVISTIYDRGDRDAGDRTSIGKLNRLYAHSISRSLGYDDLN